MDYTLKYCYRYEPGFRVYSLIDIILFEADGETTPEISRYLDKEEQFIEEEDKHQVFFIVKHFTMARRLDVVHFLKLALYIKEDKQTNVTNLVFYPLIKAWDEYLQEEKEQLVKEAVWEQERFVGLKFDIVESEDIDVYVENAQCTDSDESVTYEI